MEHSINEPETAKSPIALTSGHMQTFPETKLSLKEKQSLFISTLEEMNDTMNQCSSIGRELKNGVDLKRLNVYKPIFGINDELTGDEKDIDKVHNFLFFNFIKYLMLILQDACDYPIYSLGKFIVSYTLQPTLLNNLEKKISTFSSYFYSKSAKSSIDFLLKYKEIFFDSIPIIKFEKSNEIEFAKELIDLSIQLMMFIILYDLERINVDSKNQPEKISDEIYNNIEFILFLRLIIQGIIMQVGYLTKGIIPFVKKIIENIRQITNPKYITLNCNHIEDATDYCCGRFVTYIVNETSPTKIVIMNTLPNSVPDFEYEKKIQENPEVEPINVGVKFGGGYYKKYIKYKNKYLKLKKLHN